MSNNLPRTTWTWSHTFKYHFHELQALIIDYHHNKILIEKTRIEQDQQLLPAVLIDHDDFESIYEPFYVIPLFEKIIDSESNLIFLRQIWIDEKDAEINDVTTSLNKCVLLLEYSGDVSCISPKYEWISFNQAKVFHLFDEASKYIQLEIKLASNNIEPPNRLPWQRRQWLLKNMAWMEEQLQSRERATLLNPIVYNKSTQFGVILQANTSEGKFFLKCTSSATNDASYTHLLSQIAPEFVAAPLVVDKDKQIMITRDYGTVLENVTFALSEIESKQLSKDYARLQKLTAGKDQELVDAGFVDFRVPQLIEYINNLPMNPFFKLMKAQKDVEPSVIRNIQLFVEYKSKFKEQLTHLNDSNIPAMVCHNDLFFTNIYKPEGSSNFMFFDWVDGYVSHPFLSSMDGIREDSYLKEWMEYGSMDQLKEWARIAERFRSFAIFIGRLRDANTLETPESTKCIAEAADYFDSFLKFFN